MTDSVFGLDPSHHHHQSRQPLPYSTQGNAGTGGLYTMDAPHPRSPLRADEASNRPGHEKHSLTSPSHTKRCILAPFTPQRTLQSTAFTVIYACNLDLLKMPVELDPHPRSATRCADVDFPRMLWSSSRQTTDTECITRHSWRRQRAACSPRSLPAFPLPIYHSQPRQPPIKVGPTWLLD